MDPTQIKISNIYQHQSWTASLKKQTNKKLYGQTQLYQEVHGISSCKQEEKKRMKYLL